MQSLASSPHLKHHPSHCHSTQPNPRQLPKNSTQPDPTQPNPTQLHISLKYPFPWGMWIPIQYRVLWPTWVYPWNGMSIGSVVSAQLTCVFNTHRNTQTMLCDVCGKMPHMRTARGQIGPIILIPAYNVYNKLIAVMTTAIAIIHSSTFTTVLETADELERLLMFASVMLSFLHLWLAYSAPFVVTVIEIQDS